MDKKKLRSYILIFCIAALISVYLPYLIDIGSSRLVEGLDTETEQTETATESGPGYAGAIGEGVYENPDRKTALFCIIPDNDKSYSFLIGLLYTQIFQELYYIADFEHNGSLPIHVAFWMDEFANSVRRFMPKTVGITDRSVRQVA